MKQMNNKEKLKEQITRKLTDMAFNSYNCIITTNAKEGYMKIVYPELGLCFFKEYYEFGNPFFEQGIESSINKDINTIGKFNDTLNLKTIKEE